MNPWTHFDFEYLCIVFLFNAVRAQYLPMPTVLNDAMSQSDLDGRFSLGITSHLHVQFEMISKASSVHSIRIASVLLSITWTDGDISFRCEISLSFYAIVTKNCMHNNMSPLCIIICDRHIPSCLLRPPCACESFCKSLLFEMIIVCRIAMLFHRPYGFFSLHKSQSILLSMNSRHVSDTEQQWGANDLNINSINKLIRRTRC